MEGDRKQLWLAARVPVHYLGPGLRQPCPVSRGRWEDLTGPNVAICKAYLLDSVASQGIDASNPVFTNENSDSGCLGIEWSVLIRSGLDILLSWVHVEVVVSLILSRYLLV